VKKNLSCVGGPVFSLKAKTIRGEGNLNPRIAKIWIGISYLRKILESPDYSFQEKTNPTFVLERGMLHLKRWSTHSWGKRRKKRETVGQKKTGDCLSIK